MKQRLAETVVAAVMDEQIALRHDRGLWEPVAQMHIVRHLVIGFQEAAYVDQEAGGIGGEGVQQPLDQGRVQRAKRSETGIDQRPGTIGEIGQLIGAFAAHTALEIGEPILGQGGFPVIAHHRRGQQQVQILRVLKKDRLGQGAQAAFPAEVVIALVRRRRRPGIARAEGIAGRIILRIQPGQIGRHRGIGDLGFGAGHDTHPGAAGLGHGGKHDDVVQQDRIGPDLGKNRAQAVLDLDRGVDDGVPGRPHVGGQLVSGRKVEMRQMGVHEIRPAGFVGLAAGRGLRGQMVFHEPVFREDPDKARMTDEHGPRATLAQFLRDAHTVQGRAKAGLGEQGDGRCCVHGG